MSTSNVVDLWPWIDHPQAGRALLTARQWLRTADDAHGVDAFELLQYCQRLTAEAGAVPGEVLTMLAERDSETVAAALGLGLTMLRIDRLQTLALSLGMKVELPQHLVAQLKALSSKDGSA